MSDSHDTQLTKVKSVFWFNLPFNEVNQTAGTATTVPERSPHGLH
nr:MAG TPA: hypothetical protein [Caudoviricetes sp.]